MLFYFDVLQFRKRKVAPPKLDISIHLVRRVASAMAFLGLELRKARGGISEEVLVGFVQVHLRIRQRQAVDFPEPLKLVFILGGGIVEAQPRLLVIVDAVAKHLVVGKPDTPERLGDQDFLRFIRIDSEFEGLVQCFSP